MRRSCTARFILAALLVCTMLRAGENRAGRGVLVCRFDGAEPLSQRNDFGGLKPLRKGFSVLAPGSGRPGAGPNQRSLDAGLSGGGSLSFAVSKESDFSQGTMALWVKTSWDWDAAEIHTFLSLPLEGDYWSTICLVYHGKIGPDRHVLESNIMDGKDHAVAVDTGPGKLDWKRGEWHHVAVSWTEHSQYLYADGRLIGKAVYEEALRIGRPKGELLVGVPHVRFGDVARAAIDDVLLANVPLFFGDGAGPDPGAPVTGDFALGLAADGNAAAKAGGTSGPVRTAQDVPQLHNGKYGDATTIGNTADSFVRIDLESPRRISALEWSRDGTAFVGPDGRGWAYASRIPRSYVIEFSDDLETWKRLREAESFQIDPKRLERMTALRFRDEFEPVAGKYFRLRVLEASPIDRGRPVLMDEIRLLEAGSGKDVAAGSRVCTALTSHTRTFGAEKAIDGRFGEESAWKGNRPGEGVLTVSWPKGEEIREVSWSRSREQLKVDGVPAEVVVLVSQDGRDWRQVGRQTPSSAGKHTVRFEPCTARMVQLRITKTSDGKEPVIDEIDIR